jgi:hypothetical protein
MNRLHHIYSLCPLSGEDLIAMQEARKAPPEDQVDDEIVESPVQEFSSLQSREAGALKLLVTDFSRKLKRQHQSQKKSFSICFCITAPWKIPIKIHFKILWSVPCKITVASLKPVVSSVS